MSWTFNGGRPLYTQLVEQLKAKIVSGEYPPGQRIPPVRELAAEAGVNPNTLQRAFSELEREGLLHAERTSGRFVTEDVSLVEYLRGEMARELADQYLDQTRQLGYSNEQAVELIRRRSEET